ncbi:MAG TPA: lipid IV(A) 3-deoxy-D-manno-octulosonic acid transferase [Usitatibacter sp.]
MTRLLYALAWFIATPFVLVRLAWRNRRQGGYLDHLGERFGNYRPRQEGPYIWIHAVSLGETRAAIALVDALRQRHPGRNMLITHMTPTGRATSREAFGDSVERAWLPYDMGFAVRRFLEHYKPEFGVLLETEIWPRLLQEGKRQGVPIVLANGRMSHRSSVRYARVPFLTRWAMSNLRGIAAQTEDDARRFARLGGPSPAVLGNVKFDVTVPDEMRQLGQEFRGRMGDRMAWLAASTREGEEALLLDAFFGSAAGAEVLLVIVPRHPQRFDEVARMAEAKGFKVARRSANSRVDADVRVLVGDSIGEMLAYYESCDVVIMGGTLLPFGGQNLIEACAMARPVIVGQHTYNFSEASKGAIAAGAAVRVRDSYEAMQAAALIASDAQRRGAMGKKALEFVAAHRGAVARIVEWIDVVTKG